MDIFLAYADYALRVQFFGNEIERLKPLKHLQARRIESVRIH